MSASFGTGRIEQEKKNVLTVRVHNRKAAGNRE
jgi:hypothetical protein